MATSPKVVLAVGLAFAALCVLAGFMLESDADGVQIDAVNSAHWWTQNMPIARIEDARMHADFLARSGGEIRAFALKYEAQAAVLLVRSPRMRWQRLLGRRAGVHEIPIPDPTGSFRTRWERGVRDQFGRLENGSFHPFTGRVMISKTKPIPKSMNVLDYLQFSLKRGRREVD